MLNMPTAPEIPKLSLLEQFIQERDAFVQQSSQIQIQLQQLNGAIFACNQMIEKIKADMEEKAKDNQGASENGEDNCEKTEQVA